MRLIVGCLLVLASTLAAEITQAGVFHSRESALRVAFPEADSVAVRDLFVSEADAEVAKEKCGLRVKSQIVTPYVGWKNGEILGYAYFDTHPVRTLPETLLIVLTPGGKVRETRLLAFHEPEEYLPRGNWLEQFEGRQLSDELWLERGVAGMAGSTLTARAITSSVRRVLALHQTLHEPRKLASLGTDLTP